MILEVLVVLILLFAGMTSVFSLGIRSWPLLPLGFVVGLSLLILSGSVLLGLNIAVSPLVHTGLLAAGAATYWVWYYGRKKGPRPSKRDALWVIAVTGGVSAFVAALYMVLVPYTYIKHVDSMEYLAIGTMVSSGTFYEGVSIYQLQKRLLAVPFMHIPANVIGAYFLITITPLLALSTLGIMAWVWLKGLAGRVDRRVMIPLVILGLLLLVTNNRFIMHATYINGHLLFATLLVLLVCCGWLLAIKSNVPKKFLYVVPIVVIPTLILTRAEAALFVPIALLPMILSSYTPLSYRQLLVAVAGGSIVLWQGFVLALYYVKRSHMQLEPALGFMAIGLMILAFALIMRLNFIQKLIQIVRSGTLLWVMEIGLWLALLVFAFRDPEPFFRSIGATLQNVAYGDHNMWGASLVLLAVLFIVALVFVRVPGQIYLRYAITTFLPLVFLLAELQGGAYRVSGADSLNRMFIQIVPLAVTYVVVAMAAGEWRFKMSDFKKRTKALVIGK